MVQFNGHYDGSAITPDEHVEIPVNVPLRITVEPVPVEQAPPVDWQRRLDLASACAVDGPEDLAQRHDHYAHRKPVE